jgi:type VII secretion effector (TIGR04197 family)
MSVYSIKSDFSLANEKGSGLNATGRGLGSGSMERAQQTNLVGVQEHADMFEKCMGVLKQYKVQLGEDGKHIRELGLHFYDLDLSMAGKM